MSLTERCEVILANGRACGQPAMILGVAEGGMVCPSCFEAEVRRRELVAQLRIRRGSRKLSLDFSDIHMSLVKLHEGGLFKAQPLAGPDPGIHGTILVHGTQVSFHHTNENYPRGDPRRNSPGPGLDFAPLLDAEYGAALEWEFRNRIQQCIREIRTADELNALGGKFLTFCPLEPFPSARMDVGESLELLPWAPVTIPFAWAVPPITAWAVWRVPLEPVGLILVIDEGRVWFCAWAEISAVLQGLIDRFAIPDRPRMSFSELPS